MNFNGQLIFSNLASNPEFATWEEAKSSTVAILFFFYCFLKKTVCSLTIPNLITTYQLIISRVNLRYEEGVKV